MATYAVMQSPMEYPGAFTQHRTNRQATTREERPKLSLNTTHQRSFGRSAGLRLDTPSASSPTSNNTNKNRYDTQCFSEPIAASTSRKEPQSTLDQLDGRSPLLESFKNKHEHGAPSLKESSETQPIPYSLPRHTRSILTNGPLAKRQLPVQTPLTSSPRTPILKVSRPSVKRVCFSDPIAEDIQTNSLLFKHSDLRSRSTSPAPNAAADGNSGNGSERHDTTDQIQPPPKAREVAPRGNNETDDEDVEDDNAEGNEEYNRLPKTPIAGRHNKERNWVWTLGPLPGIMGSGSSSTYEIPEEDLEDSLGESVAAASGFSVA